MSEQKDYVEFYNGIRMPIVGLGTYQSFDEVAERTVDTALKLGYRLIDTAYVYENEVAIGRALKKWFDSGRLKREDVFIITKLPNIGFKRELVEKYLKRSLEAMQLSYVDLYLIHQAWGVHERGEEVMPKNEKGEVLIDPTTDHVSIWKGMEEQVDAGRTRTIGLSNFNSRQIKRVVRAARIKPVCLQVEVYMYFQQRELVAFCDGMDMAVIAYGPLGSPGMIEVFTAQGGETENIPRVDPLKDPVVLEIAKKHSKTAAQVMLRHLVQRGIAVIPKSNNPGRMKENFQVWGLYRGISSPLAAVAVVNAIVFGVYGNTQRHMADPDSLGSHLLAGSTAGLVQSFVCSPMELVKTRSQLQAGSPFSCLLSVVREGGVRGLYKGLGITIAREVPGYGVYFLAYEAMTRGADHLGTPHMLLAGGLSGVASWLTTYPTDVVKSRLQADTEGRYSGAVDCLRKSVAQEGLPVLTRGLTSTLLRAFPTNAATFAVVTWVMRSFADVPRDGAATYHTPLRCGEFVTLGVGAYALDDVGQHVSTAWSSFMKAAPRIFQVQHVSCGSCVATPSESQLEEDQVRAVLLACELPDDVHCSCKAVKQKPSSLNQSCCCVCSEARIMAAGGEGQAL